MIAWIASGLTKTLVGHAARAAPHEACGLLLGDRDHIEAVVETRNVAAHPETAFEIDPAALLRIHRDARGKGQHVIGHYHSHPNGRAEPSLRDAAGAVEDGRLWLIIANGAVHAWRVTADNASGAALHGRFLPVSLSGPAG